MPMLVIAWLHGSWPVRACSGWGKRTSRTPFLMCRIWQRPSPRLRRRRLLGAAAPLACRFHREGHFTQKCCQLGFLLGAQASKHVAVPFKEFREFPVHQLLA